MRYPIDIQAGVKRRGKRGIFLLKIWLAGVAELADARDLKSRGRKAVRVQLPSPAFLRVNF